MDHILVNINHCKGLAEEINIGQGEEMLQILDYKGIPFWWRRCHKYGNLVKNCKLPFHKRVKKSLRLVQGGRFKHKVETQVATDLEVQTISYS